MLAEETSSPSINETSLLVAGQERRFFRLLLDGYYDKAITQQSAFVEDHSYVDANVKGWLHQQSARAACLWGHQEKSDDLQRQAYAYNKMLIRPRVAPHYTPLVSSTDQSEQILIQLKAYRPRRGLLIELEELADWLTPEATSNQFEDSLKNLGHLLGYRTSRPEREDGVGPDVLWVLSQNEALIIEAKSRKTGGKPITKVEHGQLLESMGWFSENYPTHIAHAAIVNAVALVTQNVAPGTTFGLTFNKLDLMIQNARSLIQNIISTNASEDTLLVRCEQLLDQLQLNPVGILTYFEPLEKVP